MIAIISAGLATFVNCLFQLVNKVLDNHKENKREQKTQLNEYILKKETIYISAIDRLLQIRRGFDYTRKDIINNKELQSNRHSCVTPPFCLIPQFPQVAS